MRIGVTADTGPLERRVALTPAVAGTLIDKGHEVVVASGAGAAAGFPDAAYAQRGARIGDPGGAVELVALIGPPSVTAIGALQPGTAVVGFLEPFTNTALMRAFVRSKATAVAFEAIPRTALAQAADALSSQATAAGYAAALLAASASPRFFPMLTTAAGTMPPARVLVLGAGVAGLQAIATARRLGARVAGYDIRPESREQVASLGARFIDVSIDEETATAAGYAREVGVDTQRRQHEALAPHIAEADVLITTAAVPGRRAPLLATTAMIEAMSPGSVVVDLAASSGGNCEPTVPGEETVVDGVRVLGPLDLPSRVALHASEMYARNVAELVLRYAAKEFDDPVVAACAVVRHGEPADEQVAALLEEPG